MNSHNKSTAPLTYILQDWVTAKLTWQEQMDALASMQALSAMSQSYPYARLMQETLFHKSTGLLLSQLTDQRKRTIQAGLGNIRGREQNGNFDLGQILSAIRLVIDHCPDPRWVEHWTYIHTVLDSL
ncbi:MAG: hypothetical protein ACR2HF_07340 [Methylococcaceae bacterium]